MEKDDRPVYFRPFTRESLVTIEARIAEEYAKKKELEKKRAEEGVSAFLIIALIVHNFLWI